MTVGGHRLTIRPAQAADLADVVEIYNAGIAERVATFETRPRTTHDVSSWVEDGQPFIVVIDNRHVVGWARAGAYSDRCVYGASASTPSTSTPPRAAAGSIARS